MSRECLVVTSRRLARRRSRVSRARVDEICRECRKSAGGTRRRDDAPCRSRRRSLARGDARWRRSFARLSPLRRIVRVRARRARGNRTRPRFARPCRVRARATPWPRSRRTRTSGRFGTLSTSIVRAGITSWTRMGTRFWTCTRTSRRCRWDTTIRRCWRRCETTKTWGFSRTDRRWEITRRLGGIKGWRGRSCEWRPRD